MADDVTGSELAPPLRFATMRGPRAHGTQAHYVTRETRDRAARLWADRDGEAVACLAWEPESGWSVESRVEPTVAETPPASHGEPAYFAGQALAGEGAGPARPARRSGHSASRRSTSTAHTSRSTLAIVLVAVALAIWFSVAGGGQDGPPGPDEPSTPVQTPAQLGTAAAFRLHASGLINDYDNCRYQFQYDSTVTSNGLSEGDHEDEYVNACRSTRF